MARARATDEKALIRAAGEKFRTKGYHNTTIDDIAAAANVSRPTVYTYAKSKRWILDRLVGQLLDEIAARLEADRSAAGTPLARLRAVINTCVWLAVENRALYPVLLAEETELSPRMRKRYRAWAHQTTNEFREVLEACLSEASLDAGLDATVAANVLVSSLMSIYRWYDPNGPVTPDELTDQILMVVGGILREDPLSKPAHDDADAGVPG